MILWVWEVKVSSGLSLHYLGSSWRPCFQYRTSSLTPDDWFPNPEPLCRSVSVSAGHHNRITQTEWLKQQFLLILEAGSLRSRCPQGWFLARILFLTCRWLPSHRVLVSPPLDKTSAFWIRAPFIWPHVTLITSLQALSLNTITLGVSELRILGEHSSVASVRKEIVLWLH